MPVFRFLSLLWALLVALVPALQAGELVLPASVDAGQTDAAAYAPFSVAATAGTLGGGLSVGYRIHPNFGLRLEGTSLSYDGTEAWGSHQSRLRLQHGGFGVLVDYYPYGNGLRVSAGLRWNDSSMSYRARFQGRMGEDCLISMGGLHFQLTGDQKGEISGVYSWNALQPYLGIGYAEPIRDSSTLYYAVDLGFHYMGSGKLRVGNRGRFEQQDPASHVWSDVSQEQLNAAVRREGRDFFRIAEHLNFYPVLQLSLGMRF